MPIGWLLIALLEVLGDIEGFARKFGEFKRLIVHSRIRVEGEWVILCLIINLRVKFNEICDEIELFAALNSLGSIKALLILIFGPKYLLKRGNSTL